MASDGVSDYTAHREGGKAGQRPDSRLAGVATRAALPKQEGGGVQNMRKKEKEEVYLRHKSGRKHETLSRALNRECT